VFIKDDWGEFKQNHSEMYNKYFIKNNCDHVGRVDRHMGKENVEIVNKVMLRYLEETRQPLPESHRMCIKNSEAEYKSISKYDKSQPVLNKQAWAKAGEWTKRHFKQFLRGSKVTDEETAVKESDKTTSAGYPHNRIYKKKGEFLKSNSVGILTDYWEFVGKAQEENKPRPCCPIWLSAQKVEMRTAEKIFSNSIRTFTAAPVEHTIALGRMCLDMNNKLYKSNNKNWSFVGGNKYMGGWNSLYERLSKHPNAFELDESQYDSSLFAKALAGMVDFRFEMLEEEEKTQKNWNRLINLYESIIHSVIVLENGELVWKHTGNPSGSANTIVDNTVILFRLFAYAWIIAAEEKFGEINDEISEKRYSYNVFTRNVDGPEIFGSYQDFMDHVEAALNGDDNSFSCSDEVVGWFNPDSIATIWSGIGITTNYPEGKNKPGQKVEEISFLSQGFTNIRGFWLPKPDFEKTKSSLLYGSDLDDVRWHLLRANAIRIDTWANQETRVWISKYVDWLCNTYQKELVGCVTLKTGDKIPMSDINNIYKSDQWIWWLYSGLESVGIPENNVSGLKQEITHNKLLNNITEWLVKGKRDQQKEDQNQNG
jgi:hypothetical protein